MTASARGVPGKTTQVTVVGAGISGLVAARELAKHDIDVRVLEARDRVGGRALSVGIGTGRLDLGPAWIWPQMQPHIRELIQNLGLETLAQFETGDFLFQTHDGVQRGQYPRRYADTVRLRDGIQGLAQRLARDLPDHTIQLSSPVTGFEVNDEVQVHVANTGPVKTDFIINAVPAPIAAALDVSPRLPDELVKALTRWPTWMAAHAKVLLVYDRPFWREQGLSGSAMSHVGPLVEIADQSDEDRNLFALFGFVSWSADQRRANANELESAVGHQLATLFGAGAPAPVEYHFQDWATEEFTTTAADRQAPQHHPSYGDPLLERAWCDDRLLFAGAEASRANGGLIEGAVESGLRAAGQVLANIQSRV